MEKEERLRSIYLGKFKNENDLNEFFEMEQGEILTDIGNSIVEMLKKEDLTHDQAYVSLQYAYNKIKYESNFLKLE